MDYAYDTHNRLATQTDARTGDADYTYSDRDEVLSVTTNSGIETIGYAYDALGNQVTTTRPDASVTINEYYLRNNQLKKVSGSLTYPVEYTYDPQGRMKTLTTWQNATTSAGAAVTTWNYDTQRGWLTQKLYADATGPAYTYTDAGRLDTRTWVRTVSSAALVTTYAYNNAGQLVTTDYSDTTPDVAMTYTRFGAQQTVTDATGTRTFTYTTALRSDQEELDATFYGDRILTRSYETSGDTIGRSTGFQLGVTADLGQDYAVTYGYDTAGRLSTVTDPSSLYTYGYTTNSNLRHTLTSPVHMATTTYEANRDVIDILENKVGMTSISKYDYTVNSLGQRTARANTGTAFGTTSTDEFTYNAKGEVETTTNATISAYDRTFAYDDIGNRTSATDNIGTTSYTANTLNAYTVIGAASPTHDADGNQTTTGTGQIYTWDAENRLISVEPVLPLTSDLKQVNTYDAQSRRVRKQVYTYSGSAWSLTTDEKFIYDGWNVVAKLLWNSSTSTFDLNSTYTWGLDLSCSLQGAGGVGGLLSTKDGSSVYHYTYDANGNVSEVLNSSGGVVAHYEYDAFGNTVAFSGTYATTNAYRFSTKPLDGVSGLYYYGFRYYNPSTGRWLSRDPIQERGGLNLYGMVNNNPIGRWDYLGLSDFSADTCQGMLRSLSFLFAAGYTVPGQRIGLLNSFLENQTDPRWGDSTVDFFLRMQGQAISIINTVNPGFYGAAATAETLLGHYNNGGSSVRTGANVVAGGVTGAATLASQLRPNLSLSGGGVHAASGPTTLIRGSVANRAGYVVLAANILADASEAYAGSITQSSLNSSERDRIQGMLADVQRKAGQYQSAYMAEVARYSKCCAKILEMRLDVPQGVQQVIQAGIYNF